MICFTQLLQSGNGIGDIGAKLIGKGLKVNSSLRSLNLVCLAVSFLCAYGFLDRDPWRFSFFVDCNCCRSLQLLYYRTEIRLETEARR